MKKGLFLTYFSHFLVTRERHKNSISTYVTYKNTRILLTLLTFLSYQFCKNFEFIMNGFSLVQQLVLILICASLKQSITIWWAKFKKECLLPIFIYTYVKFTVICKTPDFEWWLVKIKYNRKRETFGSSFYVTSKFLAIVHSKIKNGKSIVVNKDSH